MRDTYILDKVGKDIYGDLDPSKVLFNEKIFEIYKEDDVDVLSIRMPFVNKEELNLLQNGDEISISIKNEKRVLLLPKKLLGKDINEANEMVDEALTSGRAYQKFQEII